MFSFLQLKICFKKISEKYPLHRDVMDKNYNAVCEYVDYLDRCDPVTKKRELNLIDGKSGNLAIQYVFSTTPDYRIAIALLNAGLSPLAKNNRGDNSLFHFAIKIRNITFFKLLLWYEPDYSIALKAVEQWNQETFSIRDRCIQEIIDETAHDSLFVRNQIIQAAHFKNHGLHKKAAEIYESVALIYKKHVDDEPDDCIIPWSTTKPFYFERHLFYLKEAYKLYKHESHLAHSQPSFLENIDSFQNILNRSIELAKTLDLKEDLKIYFQWCDELKKTDGETSTANPMVSPSLAQPFFVDSRRKMADITASITNA